MTSAGDAAPDPDPMNGDTLSVVVPVYGCAGSLPELVQRVDATLAELVDRWEIILVDDRSPDRSWDAIQDLAAADQHVRGVRLSRNFGQHAAITAGLAEATGDWVAVMDCDLQDPPETLKDLYETALSGFDVVLARRGRRPEGRVLRMVKDFYYRLLGRVLEMEIEPGVGTFSLISRKVVEACLAIGDRDRNYLLILHWLGFSRTVIPIKQAARATGKSSYSRRALIQFAVDGLFFQTTHLLRWIVLAGLGLAAVGGLGAVGLIVAHFVFHPPSGYTSLAVLVLICAGVTIASTGITALYIGRVLEHVKQRPLYVVDAVRGGAPRTRMLDNGQPAEEMLDEAPQASRLKDN
jgi:dolichol-phosphate mannosyltransferase